jgi:hypothetical protein
MQSPESPPILKLLGGAVIESGGKLLGGPATHRHRLALLAILAVTGRPASRDKLIAYLWPERDTERARNLLKTNLHELRKLLGEGAIMSTGDALSIDPALLRCDVTEYETAARAGDFAKAAGLYAGPFLDGFFVKESAEFEEWAAAERARLERIHEKVRAAVGDTVGIPSVPAPVFPSAARESISPSLRSGRRGVRRWPVAVTAVIVLGVGIAIATSFSRGTSTVTTTLKPVILPEGDAGTAMDFDGSTSNISTPIGTVVTTATDNVAFDMMVRFGGPNKTDHEAVFYNGHGGVSGWGLLVIGAPHGQPEGTIAVLAGGITITATPLVLTPGVWQHLSAERRDGRVTVSLDDKSYAVGAFPVNAVGAKHTKIERTSIGGDGTYDEPSGIFLGAIDRVRIRDLAGAYWIERWSFDEGKGPITVGAKGNVLYVGATRWTPAGRIAPQDVFWSRLETLCGQAFGGHITAAAADPTPLRTPVILYVMGCAPTAIRVAVSVGTDRSRVLVLERTPSGLRLRHDIHHEDGAVDAAAGYGGETHDAGAFGHQEFTADARTASLMPSARGDVWSIDVEPAKTFTYLQRRGGADRLRIEFSLAKQVASPPPPWGTPP